MEAAYLAEPSVSGRLRGGLSEVRSRLKQLGKSTSNASFQRRSSLRATRRLAGLTATYRRRACRATKRAASANSSCCLPRPSVLLPRQKPPNRRIDVEAAF
jgi:hypothetical protein